MSVVEHDEFLLHQELDDSWAVIASEVVKEPTESDEKVQKKEDVKQKVKDLFSIFEVDEVFPDKEVLR